MPNSNYSQRAVSPHILWVITALSLISFAVACFMGLAVATDGSFHEDGFILFRYIEHFSNGDGFAFNPGGAQVEGATPFLWVILAGFLTWLGLDVAQASIVLSALGVAITVWIFCRWAADILEPGIRRGIVFAAGVLSGIWMVGLPGYAGFATALYAALFMISMASACHDNLKFTRFTPVWVLLLGLMRPDGVVLAAGVWLIAAWRLYRGRMSRGFVGCTLGVMGLGVAYMCWRAYHFGHLLPLPLIVKSHTESGLDGVNFTIVWVLLWGWGCLLALWGAALYCVRTGSGDDLRAGLLLLPASLLFVVLSFAVQSQNVGFRLQIPIFLSVLWVLVVFTRNMSVPLLAVVWGLACAPAALHNSVAWRSLFRFDYVDGMAQSLYHNWPEGAVLAVSEAGRVPYWSRANTIDLVGLNTPETAVAPLRIQALTEWEPDLVLVHGFPLVAARIEPGLQPLPSETVLPMLAPELVPLYAHPPTSYANSQWSNVAVASVIALKFLVNDARYSLMTVKEGETVHIMGVQKGGKLDEGLWRGWVEQALQTPFSGSFHQIKE